MTAAITRPGARRHSTIHRLGLRDRLVEALDEGLTIDQITDELNGALGASGRPERVSRSAVGRAAANEHEIFSAKRRVDAIVARLESSRTDDSDAIQGRLEVLKTMLLDCALRGDGDGEGAPTVAELRSIMGGLEAAERTAELRDRRAELAARRQEREKAAEAAQSAARRRGASPDVIAAIRAAVEGT